MTDAETITAMMRDEFTRLNNRLDRFDITFAEHVNIDNETRDIALQTKNEINQTRKISYVIWGILVSIATLAVAWLKI